MNKNKQLESDLWNKNFCWKPRLWWEFFASGFFFRCLYSITFGSVYVLANKKALSVDSVVNNKNSLDDLRFPNVLGIANSTVVYPVNDYSYFHQLAQSPYVKNTRIIGKPGLGTQKTNIFLQTKNINNASFDLIIVSCLQQDIVSKGLNPEEFAQESKKLLTTLRDKLTPNGVIVCVYGDYSFHPTVPNNYFQNYFKYKTERFLGILRGVMNKNEYIIEVMNLNGVNKNTAWSYIHADGMHFSRAGQNELYRDLIKGMKKQNII